MCRRATSCSPRVSTTAHFVTDLPLSASISGVIGPDGEPQTLAGRIVADAGSFGDANADDSRIAIDRAEFKLNWDAASRMLSLPFQIVAGGNRITLIGQIEAPGRRSAASGRSRSAAARSCWPCGASGRSADPQPHRRERPATMWRNAVSWSTRATSATPTSASPCPAMPDFSCGDLRLAPGLAGTRMSVDALKRLVAGFRRAESARLVQRASQQRHAGAHRDRGERAVGDAQSQRPADSRRRAVDRRSGDAIAWSSRSTACRRCTTPISTVHIVGRDAHDHARQGDGRPAVRAQAHIVVPVVRSARYRAA